MTDVFNRPACQDPKFLASQLFKVISKVLSSQQDKQCNNIDCWNHYFGWKSSSSRKSSYYEKGAHVDLLRVSLSSPRDILAIMQHIQKIMKRKHDRRNTFPREIFFGSEFTNQYSEYMLTRIKDQLDFYYTRDNWTLLMSFFTDYNNVQEFSYNKFEDNYKRFSKDAFQLVSKDEPFYKVIKTPSSFLQFLYELNVIGYAEKGS